MLDAWGPRAEERLRRDIRKAEQALRAEIPSHEDHVLWLAA